MLWIVFFNKADPPAANNNLHMHLFSFRQNLPLFALEKERVSSGRSGFQGNPKLNEFFSIIIFRADSVILFGRSPLFFLVPRGKDHNFVFWLSAPRGFSIFWQTLLHLQRVVVDPLSLSLSLITHNQYSEREFRHKSREKNSTLRALWAFVIFNLIIDDYSLISRKIIYFYYFMPHSNWRGEKYSVSLTAEGKQQNFTFPLERAHLSLFTWQVSTSSD